MPAEPRDHLAGLLRMLKRLDGFVLEPFDDRNAAVPEDHHRVVRVAHDPGELAFENLVELVDDLLRVERHGWFLVVVVRRNEAGTRAHSRARRVRALAR